ncbi:hypothetical protein ABT095_03165 [Kitasatospora sp. NPDC002227]|uniref:hypothetical protein n=1 Tax=Kitasatospora sp. NPDC002227 TaxID=3154773 RepID=UPI0033340967
MRVNRRVGLVAAGVVLAGGLLPVPAASAAGFPGTLDLQCFGDRDPNVGLPWTADRPFQLQGGVDYNPICAAFIYVLQPGGLTGLKASYTIPADSVAASGYPAQRLARMIVASVAITDGRGLQNSAPWSFAVNGDGSLTMESPRFDVLPDGPKGAAVGAITLQFSAGSGLRSAQLHGQFKVTGAQGAVQADAGLHYVADGKSIPTGTAGTYRSVTPVRALDTRHAIGAPKAPVGPGGEVTLQVAGANGIPATGVTAVVLNVTATNATAGGYVTVYPHGQPRPTASNLNFTAGQTVPNLVTVPVVDGKINLYNFAGTTDLIGDISGYYTSDGTGSRYTTSGPTRIMDTRSAVGAPKAPVGPGGEVTLQVAGVGGVPATGVTSVVLNVTATRATTGGYVTVYPHGRQRPTASNLNFTAGQTVPNLVSVPVVDGKVTFYNFAGSVDLIADLAGYYSGTGSVFVPTGPTRVLDSRNGTGGVHAPIAGGHKAYVQVGSWKNGIPPFGTTAVVLNVTATRATTGGYVSVFSGSQAKPTASNLNFTAGQTVPNAVITPLDPSVNFFNFAGDVDLIADAAGYFTAN